MRTDNLDVSTGGRRYSITLSSNDPKDIAKLRYIFEDIGPKCYSTRDLTKIVIMLFEDARNLLEQYAGEKTVMKIAIPNNDAFVPPIEWTVLVPNEFLPEPDKCAEVR